MVLMLGWPLKFSRGSVVRQYVRLDCCFDVWEELLFLCWDGPLRFWPDERRGAAVWRHAVRGCSACGMGAVLGCCWRRALDERSFGERGGALGGEFYFLFLAVGNWNGRAGIGNGERVAADEADDSIGKEVGAFADDLDAIADELDPFCRVDWQRVGGRAVGHRRV